MTTLARAEQCQIGMVGLGVMGRNFVLNMADHGFSVAGFDKDPEKMAALRREAAGRRVLATESLEQLVAELALPRAVMLLVPAGAPDYGMWHGWLVQP